LISETDNGHIRKLAVRLRRGDPLRQVAESLLDDVPLPPDSRNILLGQLRTPSLFNWKRPLVAAWALGRLPQNSEESKEAAQHLIAILENRPGRNVGCFLLSGCLFTYLGFLFIIYASIVDGPRNRVRTAAAQSLGYLAVPESAEPLANAIMEMPGRAASGDRQVRGMSVWALYRVLSKLPDRGYGSLPEKTVQAICKLLIGQKQSVILPALEVLKLIGGISAIPTVERVEKKCPSMPARAEASKTLEILRARQAQERAHQTLLRPVGAPREDAAILLRPAGHTAESESELLLRAVDESGNGL